MKRHIRAALVNILSTSFLVSTSLAAQQSSGTRVPRLTTEDVANSRIGAPKETEISPAAPKTTPPSRTPGVSGSSSGRWVRYSPDEMNLSLELPGEPQAFEFPNINAVHEEFTSAKAFICSGDNLRVIGIHLTARRRMSVDDMKAALSGLMYGFAQSSTAHGFQYSFEVTGPSSLSVKALRKGGGSSRYQFEGVAKVNGIDLWFVGAGNSGTIQESQSSVKRVLASIQFF